MVSSTVRAAASWAASTRPRAGSPGCGRLSSAASAASALPASLSYLEERTIGPSLGADSIRSGVEASVVGLLLIVVFMLVYYRFSGLNAVVALAALIPFTPVGQYFGFVPPPAQFYFILAAMVVAYLVLVELVKRHFYRRVTAPRGG